MKTSTIILFLAIATLIASFITDKTEFSLVTIILSCLCMVCAEVERLIGKIK